MSDLSSSERVAVVGSGVAIAVILVAAFWAYPAFFQCIGQSCVGGGGTTGIGGQTTQNIYMDVVSQHPAFSFTIAGSVLPQASSTGEVIKSCQWITCAITGTSVAATVLVTGPNGYAKSNTWSFKLGEGDAEEYIWLIPSLAPGTYTVTVTETIQVFLGSNQVVATNTFTVPLSNGVTFHS